MIQCYGTDEKSYLSVIRGFREKFSNIQVSLKGAQKLIIFLTAGSLKKFEETEEGIGHYNWALVSPTFKEF